MKRLISIITYAAIALCWVLFFALLTGCATAIKYPIQMPDGSIEFAEYRNPTLFRDKDFEVIVIMPDGTRFELRKVEKSRAEDVVAIAVKAAIDAATKSAGGGVVESN